MEGISNQISVKTETTYGTPVAPDFSIPISPSDGIQIEQEVVGLEAIKTTAPKNKRFMLGKANYNGGFELDAYPKSIGYFLNSVFGTDTTSTPEAGVTKHKFTESTSKKSLTLEQVVGTITKRFAGYILASIKISGKTGEPIKVTFTGMAKSQADATKITATYETSRPLNFADVASVLIGGTDFKAYVDEFSVEYTNGLAMFFGMGSRTPANKYVQQSEAKGSMTMYIDGTSDNNLDDYIAGTERAVDIIITGDAIGVSSNEKLRLYFPKCAFTKVGTKLDFGYNALNIDFEGREDATDGLLYIELTNQTASY
jgi:hypothetical protein